MRLRALLSLTPLLLISCGSTPPTPPPGARPHLGESWYAWRGQQLNLSPDEAKARDQMISTETPPASMEDPRLMEEAAIIWQSACAQCHGANGDPSTALTQHQPPPRDWPGFGPSMGFTFGGDSMRRGIYKKIAEGVIRPDGSTSPMPAWQGTLSREQIWALVGYLEML